MTTSPCRHSPFLSREGNMWYPSAFLYSNKVESTIHRLRRSPFLSRKEHRFSCFPLISFRMLALCKKRTFRFTPAICKDCTDPGLRLTVWIIKITVKFRDRLLAWPGIASFQVLRCTLYAVVLKWGEWRRSGRKTVRNFFVTGWNE